ncbi:MAG TPA: PKD domain-containing protein, partial [Bacteroidia bacterium]|nr:PKD domain-containing protein [Bacteroidia bacterium]
DSIIHTVSVTEVIGDFNVNTVCLHDSTHFTNTSTSVNGDIGSWQWTFGDGNNSTLQNPAHLYASAGTYNVTLTVKSTTGCDSAITKAITVAPAPTPFFTFTKACLGTQTQFTDQSTDLGGTITSWTWSFGDGGTSTVENPGHTYGSVGTYNVVLVVTSATGCNDSIIRKVNVNPIPVVAFSADSLIGCPVLCTQFTDNSTISSGKYSGWQWSFGDGSISNSQNPQYCYTNSGVYTVSLTVTSDSGCAAKYTAANMISVYDRPHPMFTYTPLSPNILQPFVQFTDNTVDLYGIQSWFWTFGDVSDSTSSMQNPSHTYGDTGTFCPTLVVTNIHQCINSIEECVTVEPVFTLYIPNAFTPNGNGVNEFFGPQGEYVRSMDMYIFNRWGDMIFHTSDMTKPWDGTVMGRRADEDTYVYLVNATDTHGKVHNYLGSVTLLK